MKKAVVDQILLWMVILICFSGFFLFVVDYTNIVGVKKNANKLAEYAARMRGVGQTHQAIATGLNKLILGNMNTVSAGDILCSDDSGTANKREVIFTVNVLYDNKFFPNLTTISTVSATFNDEDSVVRTCTLTITLK